MTSSTMHGNEISNFQILCDDSMPTDVYIDKNIVEKIVMNLLNNAFKYTPDRGSIILETRCRKAFTSLYKNSYTVGRKHERCLSPSSSVIPGVGISQRVHKQCFRKRFYKVNTVNADSHLGTGIGPGTCKELGYCYRSKGTISIHSEREKGTDTMYTYRLTAVSSTKLIS